MLYLTIEVHKEGTVCQTNMSVEQMAIKIAEGMKRSPEFCIAVATAMKLQEQNPQNAQLRDSHNKY